MLPSLAINDKGKPNVLPTKIKITPTTAPKSTKLLKHNLSKHQFFEPFGAKPAWPLCIVVFMNLPYEKSSLWIIESLKIKVFQETCENMIGQSYLRIWLHDLQSEFEPQKEFKTFDIAGHKSVDLVSQKIVLIFQPLIRYFLPNFRFCQRNEHFPRKKTSFWNGFLDFQCWIFNSPVAYIFGDLFLHDDIFISVSVV